ncbi:MAG: hemolysin family protein, partial [Victivallaceae bacterium]|nr:hemolysin family protein [Victivallaceae bacterium]
KGDRLARLVCRLSDRYDVLLSTILIGNNIVNIALASVGTLFFVRLMGGELGATVSVVVITLDVLIFGEITPKCIAKDNAERFALFASPALQLCMWICAPAACLFSWWKKLIVAMLPAPKEEPVSPEELLMLVDEVQQDGGLNKNEGELLRNAIEFSERDAKDIATPRVKVGAVPHDSTKEEIARVFSETKFSRLLVYDDNIDHVVGVVHLKNFYSGIGVTPKTLDEIISPAVFVPTGEKISSILRKLQKEQAQVAVVVDEFGGTYGIITMEDVLEELVGEIWDELDNVVEPFRRLSPDAVRVDATVELDAFCDYFGIRIDSEMVTVNGWVTDRLNGLPKRGDHFTYEQYEITVLATDQRRVSAVEVKKIPAAE